MRVKKNRIDLQEMNSQPLTTLADVLGVNLSVGAGPQDTDTDQTNERASDNFVQLNIRLTRETKGRAGKVMTKMTGLLSDNAGALELVRHIKRELGCGASIVDGTIFLQGEQRERLANFLKNRGFEKVKIR